MNKNEIEICKFEMHLKKFFVCALPKGQVWKRVWILEVVWKRVWISTRHFLVCKRVRIWRTGRHTPTKNSQEYPPGEPAENHAPVSLLCAVCKVLERFNTIMSNNLNVHSSMAFYEIAPALHRCYLFFQSCQSKPRQKYSIRCYPTFTLLKLRLRWSLSSSPKAQTIWCAGVGLG